ncbi:hypothetical protein AOT83_17165 [Mycobacteroides sp. H001]|nr:hypothetical protein AOT83_17165 [Mycobacteroides sp. H001]
MLGRPFWIVLTVFCIGYVGSSAAMGLLDFPHLAILLVPIAAALLVYLLTLFNLRRSLQSGTRWTSTFGPQSLTVSSSAGQSTLNYNQITGIRRRGPYVSISTRSAGRITYIGELFPPAAIEFVRSRVTPSR